MNVVRLEVAERYKIDNENWVIIKETPTKMGYYNYLLMSIVTGKKRKMGGNMVKRLSGG